MKTLTVWQIELIPWYVFVAYWAISWLRVNRTKAREKSVDRLITLVVVVIAYNLLFSNWLRIGPLRLRFVPQEHRIAWAGIALTWVGVAVAIWARYCLGVYWSARVTLKEGHQLISSGPYALVRHPIYTGMLLGAVGTTLVVGEWRGVVAVVLLLAAHTRKAMREESLLTTEFGEQYNCYRQRTGFLFPRLWKSGTML
ncbi:MAG TPA: isoprenylcysteine carboxylmethyltransferase family protein [Candidatus Dormibacteraeota bacterium]|nr:isoprenylcysteine carboxylmethyltransferase family protein [Candidatus Dormibacteraeota bacterium]